MTLMFADLLAGNDASDGESGLSSPFVQRPREARASRGLSFTKPGSLRAEVSGPRSDPSDPLFPSHPFPLCLWGRPSQVH